jgi:2-oxoglutarate ferredoxin oxidoreductase subunit beta
MNPLISAFKKGIERSEIAPSKVCVASDILFEPEVVKDLGIDFFHTIRGRSIAFGSGLKLVNPGLKIVPFIGDLMTLGGNHFVHSSRRNMELLVICVNNFVYRVIDGKSAPSSTTTFSPYSTFEEPFNIPHLANSCGAVYTARWTAMHTEELADSIAAALNKSGFSVVEILSPGPNFYTDIDGIETDLIKFYYENSVIKNGEEPKNVGIHSEEKIVVGTFTDTERPTFIQSYNAQLTERLGDKFSPYGVQNG